MPDDFEKWNRVQDRRGSSDRFVSRARHVHRFNSPRAVNESRLEARRDRLIFLWVVGILVAVGAIVVVAMLRSGGR